MVDYPLSDSSGWTPDKGYIMLDNHVDSEDSKKSKTRELGCLLKKFGQKQEIG